MKTIKMCVRQDVSVIGCWIYMPKLFAFHMFHFVLFCSWNWLCGTAKLGPNSSIFVSYFYCDSQYIAWIYHHHYKIGITLFFFSKMQESYAFCVKKNGARTRLQLTTPKLYRITFAPVKQLWMTTNRYH
jgi:hypothetical protein